MKKLIFALLCLMLVGAMALSVAAAGSSVAISPSASLLDREDTFTVVAELTNSDPIMIVQVVLDYDERVFELVGGTCDVPGVAIAMVVPAQKVGTCMLSSATVVTGKIFTFNFKVKADAPFGTYDIAVTAAAGVSGGEPIGASGATITVACRHEYEDYTSVDDQTHQRICKKCGDVEKESHEWSSGTIVTKPTCEQEGAREKQCQQCGAKTTVPVDATGHAWDHACDTDCNNNCGLTRETVHEYETTFTSDETGHWYACSICADKKDFAEHTPGPEATMDAAQICLDCNYEIAPQMTHEHQMSDSWISDEDYHWHRCQFSSPSCYYVEDKAEHDYDNDCDVDCNTCGYIRLNPPHNYHEDWMGDADGHWYFCLSCGAKTEPKAHVPGPEATETEPQRCKVCNIVTQMPLNHVHEFGSAWYYDEDGHWQCCSDPICFETTESEPHTWDEGLDLADGGKQFSCTVCGKKMVTEGPAPTVPTTPPTTQPTTAPQKDSTTEDQSGFSWEWIAIAAIVLLAIGFILLIIEFIRSRKRNRHGRFSK